ncbi:hypothetical protein D9615_003768 [Tricholomella constricta]|uniref:Uncharacterized protein n=1 Tax=Tricholomella constricta TaxID=117010 RepID=A0A8H5M7J2_9AGAR|nr:hypothetical protein D9615_003768 [Tricholomella constricta]
MSTLLPNAAILGPLPEDFDFEAHLIVPEALRMPEIPFLSLWGLSEAEHLHSKRVAEVDRQDEEAETKTRTHLLGSMRLPRVVLASPFELEQDEFLNVSYVDEAIPFGTTPTRSTPSGPPNPTAPAIDVMIQTPCSERTSDGYIQV